MTNRKLVGRELPYESIQESWEHFAADVLSDASADQRRAMRNAFFAGTATCFMLMMKGLRASNRTKSHALLDAIHHEVAEFMNDEVFGEMSEPKGNA